MHSRLKKIRVRVNAKNYVSFCDGLCVGERGPNVRNKKQNRIRVII